MALTDREMEQLVERTAQRVVELLGERLGWPLLSGEDAQVPEVKR